MAPRVLVPALALYVITAAAPDARAGQVPPAPAAPSSPAAAAAAAPLAFHQAGTAPRIDGTLDDAIWTQAPLATGDWLSYNPLYGDTLPHRTIVWAAYDARYLYFAFHCIDPEPGRIKTSIARRDSIFSDDWVGLKLDAMGNGQTSYDMFVNPSGIQGDILTSAARGESSSVDWVWDSAARRTDDGYTVEMRVPVQSIRFRSGPDVQMRVLFWRRVSRLGMSVAWPDIPPGKSAFERQADLRVGALAWPGVREVMPTVTESVNQERRSPAAWNAAGGKASLGVSGKFGLSSAVTLDGTINPDFSQVESDSFQVQVNQRYPLFYSEKRPFFMEGMGVFELAGSGGDGNMSAAVHTRRIVDPSFGVKLSGTLGKVTFGTISAADSAEGRLDPQYDGKQKLFNIARATYSLGPGSYVGAIASDTEFADGHNRVAGGDVSLRFGGQQVSATTLYSTSATPDGGESTSGGMAQAMYAYSSRRYGFATQLEHYDEHFRMDTAFLKRTGVTGGWSYAGINLYPDKARWPWFKRVNPFVFVQYAHDRAQGGDDFLQVYAVRSNFTRNGNVRVDAIHMREAWAGREFDQLLYRLQASAQLLRWLYVSTSLRTGDELYYDDADSFVGSASAQSVSVTLQPSARFQQSVSLQRVTLEHPASGEQMYDVRILNTKTTYQFTSRLAARGIVQYDSSSRRVLTDLLGSYEVRPGTVFYAGYGALIHQRGYRDQQWIDGEGEYLTTTRGLFIKASYLHRF